MRWTTTKFVVSCVLICGCLVALVMCTACAGTPTIPTSQTGEGPASTGGTAKADVSKVLTNPATAFAQPTGTAKSTATQAHVERQNTNTQAGESVIVFPSAASYVAAAAKDPIMVALAEAIAKTDPKDEAFEALAAKFTARGDELRKILTETSPDFGNVKVLNVFTIICKDNGAAEGETGDKQVEAVSAAMAKIVEATVAASAD